MLRRSGYTILYQMATKLTQNTEVPLVKIGTLIVKVPCAWLKISQLMEIEQRKESRDQGTWLVPIKKRF